MNTAAPITSIPPGLALLTRAEAARWLHLHPGSVDLARRRGELAAVYLGKRAVRFSTDALRDYVERRTIEARR